MEPEFLRMELRSVSQRVQLLEKKKREMKKIRIQIGDRATAVSTKNNFRRNQLQNGKK